MNRTAIIRSLKRILGIGLVLLSAGIIISAVERKEASLTTTVTVDIEPLAGGHMLITEEDIRDKIDQAFGYSLEGMPLSAIDIERVERILEEDRFILQANAYIDYNNHIEISVRQRKPVLRVIDANGLNYYLDEDGLRMPLSGHHTARVMVATGHLPPHVPDFLDRPHYGLTEVFRLARMLRADPLFDPLFEQIHYTAGGELVLIPKVGDQRVEFGRPDQMEEKLENLKIFYLEALPYEGWEKYKSIDLRYNRQVVAKKT